MNLEQLRKNYIRLATRNRNHSPKHRESRIKQSNHFERLDAWKALSSYVDNLEKRKQQIHNLQGR